MEKRKEMTIDLRKRPYRGIVAEIAREHGKRPPNVYAALFYQDPPNPQYAADFVRKVKERSQAVVDFEKLRKAI